jgi:hypothetical protein
LNAPRSHTSYRAHAKNTGGIGKTSVVSRNRIV